MILILVKCSEYEMFGLIEETCIDGDVRVIGDEDEYELPLGFRVTSVQEGADKLDKLRSLKSTSAKLADGYLSDESSTLQAFYDEDKLPDNISDFYVVICSHEREQVPVQPKVVPCDRKGCFLIAKRWHRYKLF